MLLKEFHEPSHVLKLVIAVVVVAAAVAVSLQAGVALMVTVQGQES